MNYFKKIENLPEPDLSWNIPETKQGTVNVIGGNSQHFKTEIRVSEYMGENFPVRNLFTVLPDALKNKLPNLPNFMFLESTESGSFASDEQLAKTFDAADCNLLIGDLSKNSVTGKAVVKACVTTKKPLLITRDSVDLVAENITSQLLMNDNLIFFASMAQLIKLFRAVYYPKMLLLSQSLIQVSEALHKFTLSYPVAIVTLHNEQILLVKNGEVEVVELAKSGYSPITFWRGELACKILALNLYNPNQFMKATITALLK